MKGRSKMDPAKRNAVGSDRLKQKPRNTAPMRHPLDPPQRNAVGMDGLPGSY